jgi:hypothetical protein
MGRIMLERSRIVKPYPYPLKHRVYFRPIREPVKTRRPDFLIKPRKGVTLIAGMKCTDGFLVAADTAVTIGNTVSHGNKLYLCQGNGWKLVIAGAGYLSTARMTYENIRDRANRLNAPSVLHLKRVVKKAILDTWTTYIWPYFRDHVIQDAPLFSLMVGIEAEGQFELLVSENAAISEVETYAFQGSGTEIAQYLGETFLRMPPSRTLTFPVAVGVHLAIELFGIAKLYGASVGLDTQIIAWRAMTSHASFLMPVSLQTPSDIGIIQNNFKQALLSVLGKQPSYQQDFAIEKVVGMTRALLSKIKDHMQKQSDNDVHFIRYQHSRMDGFWSMEDLDPNSGVPPAATPSSPTEPEPPPEQSALGPQE